MPLNEEAGKKFNWRRIPINDRSNISEETDPEIILNKSHIVFNKKAVEKILSGLELELGFKARAIINVDDEAHALGFIFFKGSFSNSLSFSPCGKDSRNYRVNGKMLCKHSDVLERSLKLKKKQFALHSTISQDPDFEGSVEYVAFIE